MFISKQYPRITSLELEIKPGAEDLETSTVGRRIQDITEAPEVSASKVFSRFKIVSLSFLRSRSTFFKVKIRFFPVSVILKQTLISQIRMFN